mgnify:CR=1 FL=1
MSPATARDSTTKYCEQECRRCGRHFMRKAKATRQGWCCDCAPVNNRERKAREYQRLVARRKEAAA